MKMIKVKIDWKENIDWNAFKDDYEPMQDWLMNKCFEIEERVLTDVLFKLLHRNITIEDFKNCSRIAHIDWHDKYIFAYKGIHLGMIERFYGNRFKVRFTPIPTKAKSARSS